MTQAGSDGECRDGCSLRQRISFGSLSEYSFDMSQFQGADGSDNDFRESVCGQNWGFEGYNTNSYAEYDENDQLDTFRSRGCSLEGMGEMQKMRPMFSSHGDSCSIQERHADADCNPVLHGASQSAFMAQLQQHRRQHFLQFSMMERHHVYFDPSATEDLEDGLPPSLLQAWIRPRGMANFNPFGPCKSNMTISTTSTIPDIVPSSTVIEPRPCAQYGVAGIQCPKDKFSDGRGRIFHGHPNTEYTHWRCHNKGGERHSDFTNVNPRNSTTNKNHSKMKRRRNRGGGNGRYQRDFAALGRGDASSSTCESRVSLSEDTPFDSTGDTTDCLSEGMETVPKYVPPHKRGLKADAQQAAKTKPLSKTNRPIMTMSYYPLRVNRSGDAASNGSHLQPTCEHVGGVKVWQPYNNVCKFKEKSSEENEATADCETLPLWTPSTTSSVVGDFRVLKGLAMEKDEKFVSETGDESEEAKKINSEEKRKSEPGKEKRKDGIQGEEHSVLSGVSGDEDVENSSNNKERFDWQWQQRVYGKTCQAVGYTCDYGGIQCVPYNPKTGTTCFCPVFTPTPYGCSAGAYPVVDGESGTDDKIRDTYRARAAMNRNDKKLPDETNQKDLEADNETILVYNDERASFHLDGGREKGSQELKAGWIGDEGTTERKYSGRKSGQGNTAQRGPGNRRKESMNKKRQKNDDVEQREQRASDSSRRFGGEKGGRGSTGKGYGGESARRESGKKSVEKTRKSWAEKAAVEDAGQLAREEVVGRAELDLNGFKRSFELRESKPELNLLHEMANESEEGLGTTQNIETPDKPSMPRESPEGQSPTSGSKDRRRSSTMKPRNTSQMEGKPNDPAEPRKSGRSSAWMQKTETPRMEQKTSIPRLNSEESTDNWTAEERVSESEAPEEGEPVKQTAETSESSPTASPKGSGENSTPSTPQVDDEATEIEAELTQKEFVPKKSAILSSVENLPFVGKSQMSLDLEIGKLSSDSGPRQTKDYSEPTNQKDPVEEGSRGSKTFNNREAVENGGDAMEEQTSPSSPPNLDNVEDNSTKKSKVAANAVTAAAAAAIGEEETATSMNRPSTATTFSSVGRSTATRHRFPPGKVSDKSKNNGNSAIQSWSSAPTKLAIDPVETADSKVWRRKKPGTATETGSAAWATPAYSPRSETKTEGTTRTEQTRSSDLSSNHLPYYGNQSTARHKVSPRKGREYPTTGRESPTKGRESPTKGSGYPTKGRESPTKGSRYPTEGRTSPTKSREYLTKGSRFPTEGRESPTKGRESPTKGSGYPIEGRESPIKGRESPVKGRESPNTKGKESPTKEAESPTSGRESPIKGRESPRWFGKNSEGNKSRGSKKSSNRYIVFKDGSESKTLDSTSTRKTSQKYFINKIETDSEEKPQPWRRRWERSSGNESRNASTTEGNSDNNNNMNTCNNYVGEGRSGDSASEADRASTQGRKKRFVPNYRKWNKGNYKKRMEENGLRRDDNRQTNMKPTGNAICSEDLIDPKENQTLPKDTMETTNSGNSDSAQS